MWSKWAKVNSQVKGARRGYCSLSGAVMPYKCNKCRLVASLIWIVVELPYGQQPTHPRVLPLQLGECRVATGSECKNVSRKSIAVATCIPSRCARENCVRCACTAGTELTEGRHETRQRTLASEDPTATASRGRSRRTPATSDSIAEHYGPNRRSTDPPPEPLRVPLVLHSHF
ncbi:unnamed protein product [Leptosia nina]|uniref:Uncharacterized protein n=1 Tax=Leptosia nina TaxID=320188 RepID=A0AAV1J3E9_9NEOP